MWSMALMADQPDQPVTPLSCPEQLPIKDSRGNRRPTCEVENGGERRQRRRGQCETNPQILLDTGPVPSDSKKTSPVMRSKPVEPHLPMLNAVDYETKFERKKAQPGQLSKTNAQYHKFFKEVSKDEPLRQSKCHLLKCIEENDFAHVCCVLVIGYTCALQRDILYQGKMFVSDNWICFHSKVFGRDTKIAIPVLSVTFLKKTKTALLVPNALVIETAHEQHVFVSFLSRNTTFKLLKSICNHLEVDKVCCSPVISCPSPLPLDFSGDLSDLDGVVQQRHQEMMESSSSGSQTPDSDKMTEFPVLQDSFLSAVKSGDVSVHADIHLQSQSHKHGATLKNSSPKTAQPMPHNSKFSQHVPLNVILFMYLFLVSVLVLSSCYMAFKIVALEHRLNSLLSMGERIPHKPQDDMSTEIYGELSTNLFKLEKIQRNLQKLLEET